MHFYQVLHHNNLVEKCEKFKKIKIICFSGHISAERLHFPYVLVTSTGGKTVIKSKYSNISFYNL